MNIRCQQMEKSLLDRHVLVVEHVAFEGRRYFRTVRPKRYQYKEYCMEILVPHD
jgi:hypothetical protein